MRAGAGYAVLFRNPNFLKLLFSELTAVLGFAVSGVCLIWIIFVSTHSSLAVASQGVTALGAGILFSLVGGTLVDRYDRRRLMIVADVVRAVNVGALVAFYLLFGFNLVAVLTAVFITGTFSTLFGPAQRALVPRLLPKESLADANGLFASAQSIAGFGGSALAGALIVTVGPVAGLAVNSVTFLVSAIFVALLRVPPAVASALPAAPAEDRHGFRQEVGEGLRWLYRATGLFQLTISAMVFNFFWVAFQTFLVFYSSLLLHGSGLVFASLFAANGAGYGLGALLVGRVGSVRYAGKAWVIPYGVVSGAIALGLAVFPSVPLALGSMFALGILGGFAAASWLTAAQLLVPTEMQGRYFGVDNLGSWAILPAGQVLGGILIGLRGVQDTYVYLGAGWVIAGALFLLLRPLRQLGYHGGVPAPGESTSASISPVSPSFGVDRERSAEGEI